MRVSLYLCLCVLSDPHLCQEPRESPAQLYRLWELHRPAPSYLFLLFLKLPLQPLSLQPKGLLPLHLLPGNREGIRAGGQVWLGQLAGKGTTSESTARPVPKG